MTNHNQTHATTTKKNQKIKKKIDIKAKSVIFYCTNFDRDKERAEPLDENAESAIFSSTFLSETNTAVFLLDLGSQFRGFERNPESFEGKAMDVEKAGLREATERGFRV